MAVSDDLKRRAAQARKGNPQVLLPLIHAWFDHVGEPVWSPETLEMAKYVLDRRAAAKYEWARNSPSSGAGCIRFSVIDFMRYPRQGGVTFRTRMAFMNGDLTHLKWQMVLFEMGLLREPEIRLEVPEWGSEGTCDGITDIPKGYDVAMKRPDVLKLVQSGKVPVVSDILEIKGMGPWRFDAVERNDRPEPSQEDQGLIYTIGARRKHELYGPIRGVNFLMEKKGDDSVLEFHREPDPEHLARLEEFFGQVLQHAQDRTLPERPFDRNSKICRWCWHRDRCNALEDKGATKIRPAKGKKLGKFMEGRS